MSVISWIVLIFSLLGAADRILGNRFGPGKEFERGFELFGAMALSMIGMIVLAPALGVWLKPVFEGFYSVLGLDPSVIPAMLFANDMGGASLALEIAKDPSVGAYNAFVVSSMMGCVISFTIPFASGIVKPEQHRELFFGFLCGIVTIPVGCVTAGFLCGLSLWQILWNQLPLLLVCGVLAVGILVAPDRCVKLFRGFGNGMKVMITAGLALGIVGFLSGQKVFEALDTLQEGAMICVSACVTLSGAFVLMHVLAKLLRKPMTAFGRVLKINGTAALALVPTLVTNAATFGMMKDMDRRGVVLNAALCVSGAFVFGSHLGFTMGYNEAYVVPMMVGKIVSGVSAVILAALVYREKEKA